MSIQGFESLRLLHKIMKFFQYVWNLCCVTSKKIGIALFHLIFITLFCTLPHELGHAIAASWFSYRVDHIMIDFVRSSDYWFSFNLFGYEIRFGRVPRKKFFWLVKEYNILTIIYNFLAVLWSPSCDVRRIFSLLFRKN